MNQNIDINFDELVILLKLASEQAETLSDTMKKVKEFQFKLK